MIEFLIDAALFTCIYHQFFKQLIVLKEVMCTRAGHSEFP